MNTSMILTGLTGPAPEGGWFSGDDPASTAPAPYDWASGAPHPYGGDPR